MSNVSTQLLIEDCNISMKLWQSKHLPLIRTKLNLLSPWYLAHESILTCPTLGGLNGSWYHTEHTKQYNMILTTNTMVSKHLYILTSSNLAPRSSKKNDESSHYSANPETKKNIAPVHLMEQEWSPLFYFCSSTCASHSGRLVSPSEHAVMTCAIELVHRAADREQVHNHHAW